MHNIIRIIRDDAGNAGGVVQYKAPPKNARFWALRGGATKILENRLNQSTNPSPLIREGPAQNVCAWSEHGRRMVGGMGRAALYLKVSPTGLWPAARSRPVELKVAMV